MVALRVRKKLCIINTMKHLQQFDQELSGDFYHNWLLRKNIPHVEDTEVTVSPKETLQAMLNVSIEHNGHKMTALEKIVSNMVLAAINGDKAMMIKIYDEMQHDGADKVVHEFSVDTLTPAAKMILERRGVIDIEHQDIPSEDAGEATGDLSATSTPDTSEYSPEDLFEL